MPFEKMKLFGKIIEMSRAQEFICQRDDRPLKMKLIKIPTISQGGFLNFLLKLFFLQVIEKKVLKSNISLFLLTSKPCYKKSRTKFKSPPREVFRIFISFSLSCKPSLQHKKLWGTTLLEVGKITKTKICAKTRSKCSTTKLLTVDQL